MEAFQDGRYEQAAGCEVRSMVIGLGRGPEFGTWLFM